jgi:hypothetical protein
VLFVVCQLTIVDLLVCLELLPHRKCHPAPVGGAHKRLGFRLLAAAAAAVRRGGVFAQEVGFGKHEPAFRARMGLCRVVQNLVPPEMRCRPELLVAPGTRAGKCLVVRVLVRAYVCGEMRGAEVRLAALAAYVGALSRVLQLVFSQARGLGVCLVAAGVGTDEAPLGA